MWNLPIYPWIFTGLVALALVVLCVLIATSRALRGSRSRAVSFVLRALVVGILFVILADPIGQAVVNVPPEIKRHVLLFDTSESMSLGAPRSRLDTVRGEFGSLMEDPRLAPRIAAFSFDRDACALDPGECPVEAAGGVTHLAGALNAVFSEIDQDRIAGMVVFSDGRIHDEAELARGVRLARAARIPVFVYVPEIEQAIINMGIENCIVERRVSPRSRIPLHILLRGEGTSSQRCTLTVATAEGRVCQEVPFTACDGLSQHELYVDVGERSERYVLAVSPLPGEITQRDNRYEFEVAVTDPTLRILYMEGTHEKHTADRWEYEYLELALKGDGTIEVDSFVVDDQYSTSGRIRSIRDPRRSYPTTRRELFGYDVVISSDINRHLFTEEQKRWTVELVAGRGGGFCMIGGHTSFGSGGYDQTIWEQLIPVDMELRGGEGYVHEQFRLEIPETAYRHPVMQISPDPEENRRILKAIPPFLGTNFVKRAKPGATVLAIHQGRRFPIICVQPYGKGRTMAFVTDTTELWGRYFETRWGEGSGDNRYYNRFWINAVRWLGENRMRRSHLQGNTERISYHPGQIVKLTARWVGEGGRGKPIPDMSPDPAALSVTARFKLPGSRAVSLRYDGDREEFLGALKVPLRVTEEELSIAFQARAGTEVVGDDTIDIRCSEVRREFVNPTTNPALLEELARVTGGRRIRSREELAGFLTERTEKKAVQHSFSVPLWDRVWLWGALVMLLTVDWVIRRLLRR